jgi:hypothetical protein
MIPGDDRLYAILTQGVRRRLGDVQFEVVDHRVEAW